MFHHTATLRILRIFLVAATVARLATAKPPGDTVVYGDATKDRVHVDGCRRLTKDPAELAKMTKSTLAEAEARGALLCSRCPGSDTPAGDGGKDQLESWVNPPRDEVLRKEFQPADRAPLVSLGLDGRLVYRAFSDKGDRIIDFSTAGYRRSEEPIPTVSVVETLTPPAGDAKADGNFAYPVGLDSFRMIQDALNRAAAREPGADGFRGAVLLKSGTWYVSEGLLVKSGVVLRGEGDGEDGTVLIFTIPSGEATGIQVGAGSGGTTTQTETPLAGVLSKDPIGDDYILTMEDGATLDLEQPRFKVDFDLKDYVGSRVVVEVPLLTTTQGGERWYALKHGSPYSIKRLDDGETAPPRLVGLDVAPDPEMPETRIADIYLPTGATEITVEDASIFQVGDLVDVVKTTNDKWIEVLGVGERLRHIRGGKEGAGKRPWQPTDYSHLRTITAITGNTITIDVMMPQSIVAEHGGGLVRKAEATESVNCGVEALRVVSNYDQTQESGSKDANFQNLKNGIGISAVDGWVRDCTVMHVWYAAVQIDNSRFVTVRNIRALQPVGPKRGGKLYTYAIGGGNNVLVDNCYAEDGRHDFVIGARMAGPFVFLNSKAVRGGQSEPHARWGVGTLYDNIRMEDGGSLAAINRGDSGSGHGWAAANTVFWNCAADNIVVYDVETEGENNFAFGFKGTKKAEYDPAGLKYANTRAGYWGTPQEGIYYGYALMGSGHIESPDQPTTPDSLFMQQLIDRIGEDRARAVFGKSAATP